LEIYNWYLKEPGAVLGKKKKKGWKALSQTLLLPHARKFIMSVLMPLLPAWAWALSSGEDICASLQPDITARFYGWLSPLRKLQRNNYGGVEQVQMNFTGQIVSVCMQIFLKT
jgi:hypothetical protein